VIPILRMRPGGFFPATARFAAIPVRALWES
jgi:hypothetical protein